MAKDDIFLRVELGKLEIETVKVKIVKEDNPFVPVSLSNRKTNIFSKTCQQHNKCLCGTHNNINLPICKKKPKKILKEPILKLLQVSGQTGSITKDCLNSNKKVVGEGSDILSLCALVDNCNQLRISAETNEKIAVPEQNNENQWWKTKLSTVRLSKESSSGMSQAGSCSQQALNPSCDVTIDELASYFETLVHIPKKMSSMAEMMYI